LTTSSPPSFTWFDECCPPVEPVPMPIRDVLMPVRPRTTWSVPLLRLRRPSAALASSPPAATAPTAAAEWPRKSRRERRDMALLLDGAANRLAAGACPDGTRDGGRPVGESKGRGVKGQVAEQVTQGPIELTNRV